MTGVQVARENLLLLEPGLEESTLRGLCPECGAEVHRRTAARREDVRGVAYSEVWVCLDCDFFEFV